MGFALLSFVCSFKRALVPIKHYYQFLLLPSVIFLIPLIGIFFTEYLPDAFKLIIKYLPYFVISVAYFYANDDLKSKIPYYIRQGLIYGVLLTIIYLFIKISSVFFSNSEDSISALFTYRYTYRNFIAPIDSHTTYLGVLIIMANYFLFISRHKVVVKFIFFFINVLGVVFISSKIVSIIFLIQVVFLIFLIPRKRMKIIISSFMTISLTMFVLIHINNSNNFYMIQRLTREIVWDLNPANRGTSVNGKVADDSRLARWKAIFNTGKENLLFGYGTGSESTILKEVHLENNLKESIRRNYNTHNQYIFYILENGILGLLVFLLFLYKNLFSALKRRDYAVITFVSSIIIISAVENYFNRTMGVLAISIFLTFLKEDNAEANSNF